MMIINVMVRELTRRWMSTHSLVARMNVLFVALVLCFSSATRTTASHKGSVSQNSSYYHYYSAAVSTELRSGYHFQPPRNWMNDPNGPMYYKGIYHLFYQWNPAGSIWGNIRWAHSYSTDMINWKSLPLAITPTKPFDINGCWSGSATILPGDKPVIFYTGIDPQHRQVQNIAFPHNLSDPFLREWYKPDYNPVISPLDGINGSEFRDPSTAWYENGHWNLIVGSRRHRRGLAFLYKSRDLIHWDRAKHPLHSTPKIGMFECVDFYPVRIKGKLGLDTSSMGAGMKHVLKASLDNHKFDYYTVGKYFASMDKYVPDTPDIRNGLRYDYGNFYASKTFFDPVKQRRILWGWANESDNQQIDIAKGWAGLQVIPRSIWLDDSGRQLVQWPTEEVESLRGKSVIMQEKQIGNGELIEVKGIETSQADVEVTFDVPDLSKAEPFDPAYTYDAQALCARRGAEVQGGVGPFGLVVLASSDMKEKTCVFFRIFKAHDKHVVLMCTDPTSSTLNPDPKIYKPTFAGFVDIDIAITGKISLRSLIDNSVVESFGARGKTCITSRVYPTKALGKDAKLFVFNNGYTSVKVSELKAWEMQKPLMNEA